MMGIDGLQEALVLTGIVVTAITGAAGVLTLASRVFRSTIGRRRVLARKLERLATTMQLGYFVHVLGEPQQRRVTSDESQIAVWMMEDAYVQALADPSGMVTRWSVTTRTRRFSPIFYRGHTITSSGDTLEIRLGITRFAELPSRPQWLRGDVGARRSHYDEGYYFGNPGNYQPFAYSLNDAGYVNDNTLITLSMREHGLAANGDREVQELTGRADVAAARAHTAVNTITVGAPHSELGPDESWLGYGPDRDVVRVVPGTSLRARWRSWRRSLTAKLKRWRHKVAGPQR